MKETRDESVEELAQELESRISRNEEDELEEIVFEDIREESRESRSGSRTSGRISRERFDGEGEFPEEEPEDEWEEDDNDSVKPWVIAVSMAGVIALAAIICAVLWHFTHLEPKDEEGESRPSASVSSEYAASTSMGADGSTEAASDASVSAPTSEPTELPESAPVSTASPTPTAAPAVTPTPAASQTTPPSAAVQEPVSGTTAMEFTQDNADVTPKDVINLRSEPSTLNADNIVVQAKNGEILNRTGINEATGWTRLDYNGETLYAVSQYLTTDLTYKTPVQAADPNRVNTLDGRIIIFTDCSDDITPKEYVNLRTEPSTSEGETTVRCQISNGEVVHRTGYSPDAGWSRVEYNGEVLYVVSSYMYTVQP
ncbi:MAG: hypothetical protein NC331_02985 [Lachnospiraceae bacterium]|nr:hypothetical protein [Lachnospiraceae bacterium]MCM1238332.1 hypothetical protein [Lachnospiraceae bacterium]